MSFKIEFDTNNNPIAPTIVLSTHSGHRLGVISNAYDINFSNALMEAPELSFSVARDTCDGCKWEHIKDFKLVNCLEQDIWFQIQVEIDDADATVKNVICKGLCRSELSQTLLHGLEFNTEDDIARDDYERSLIYNFENPKASILHGIFDKVPHYKITHVDASIASMQKTFTFDGVSVEDALNTISEECHCIVKYNDGTDPDTNMPAREIAIYDLEQICNDCGHRGEFTDVCPKCGSKNIKYGYGKDTGIFVTKDNLTEEVVYSTDVDSVKNCFKLVAGDDIMTSAIQMCNPNGTDYIWYISDELKEDMPPELVKKLDEYSDLYNYYRDEHVTELDPELVAAYNELIEKYKPYNKDLVTIDDTSVVGYPGLVNIIYDVIDFDAFIQSALMPIDGSIHDTTAEEQASLLTTESLSPIALSTVSEYSEDIVNQTVLAMARIIVDKRYDVQIKSSKFFYIEDEEENEKHRWVGSFTVTNYADENLTADTGDILIFINKDYDKYIRQRVEKVLADTDVEDFSIPNLLDIDKSLEEFKDSIKSYNISVLLNIKDACDTCLDTLQSESIGNQTLWDNIGQFDFYDKYYLNYYNKLEAVVAEIESKNRDQKTIDNLYDFVTNERDIIQDTLNFEKYLGEDLWLIFCSYRREDIYKNENYISDSLNNAEIIENAMEFYEIAEKEIFKSATLQHSITSTFKNLLAIPVFAPLVDYFELGNWIRIEVDNEIYRLRLIRYEIDFENLEELKVEFSDVTKTADGITDVNSLLEQTSSMASSYGGVKRQATKGNAGYAKIADWVQNGLDATLTKIVDDGGSQDVVFSNHGILIREYDDITESYYPTQMKFINSILALTTDNWKTIKTAVGNFIYQDPITQEYKSAYGVNAETLVGSLILGQQLGIYNEAASLSFDENGLWIYNDVNSFRVNPNSDTLLSLSKDDEKMLWVDENGMLHIHGDGAGLDITANSSVTNLQAEFKVASDEILAKVEDTEQKLSSKIEVTAGEIREEVSDKVGGLESKITQTASDIRSEVSDYVSDINSTIDQTADSIRGEIKSAKEGLESSFSQTVDEIKTEVSNLDEGLNSKIDQTAEKIREEVTSGDEKLQASITTTAEDIRGEVEDKYNGLSSTLTETADSIRADVNSKYEGLSSSLEIQAGQIESLVKADEGLSSSITQTYGDLHAEVENAKSGLKTEIDAQADRITAEVKRATDAETSLSSRITQTADSLTSEIEKTTKMESELSSRIEQTVDSVNSSVSSLIVGARNFAYQTSGEWEDVVITNKADFQTVSAQIHIKNKGVKAGDTIIVHFDVKFSEDFKASGTGTKNSYVVINKNPTGSAVNVSINNQKAQLESIMASAKKEGHISLTFAVTQDMLDTTYSDYMLLYVRFDYYTGTFWWKNLMVEIGTKENAWLQAPEDINVNFYDVQTYVKQNKDNIEIAAKRADEHEAKINVNADKIDFVVKGDKTSGFSITDEAISMTAQQINAKGMITFSGLDSNAKQKINACAVNTRTLYALGPSNTSAPDKNNASLWKPSVDWSSIKTSSNFVWQLVETTYGDQTISKTDPVCISDGKDIAGVKTQYYLHTSSTSAPTNVSWSDTCPDFVSGKFIWTRQYITYTDGSTKTTTPVYDSGLTKTNNSVQAAVSTKQHSVYYSPTAPSAPHVEGDVWYKTGEDTATSKTGVIAIYVWTAGGSWQEYQIGSTMILNGTVVSDLLAANAVTSDKIYANAVTSAKLATDAIKSNNYSYTSGNYSDAGTFLDLANGRFISKNFAIDSSGNAYFHGSGYFSGEINATSGTFNGDVIAQNFYANNSIKMYGQFSWNDYKSAGTVLSLDTVYSETAQTYYNTVILGSDLYRYNNIGVDVVGANVALRAYKSLTLSWGTGYDDALIMVGPYIDVNASSFNFNGEFNQWSNTIDVNIHGKLTINSVNGNDITIEDGNIKIPHSKAYYTKDEGGSDRVLLISGQKNSILMGDGSIQYEGVPNIFMVAENVIKVKSGSQTTLSDERFKKDIQDIPNAEAFIMSLEPKLYRFTDGTSNRYHTGFLAGDVRERMLDTVGDFGVYVRYPARDDMIVDNDDPDSYRQALRYDELIAPHIRVTQIHNEEINKLKARISELEDILAELKSKLEG